MRRHTVQFELPGEANGALLRIDVAMIAAAENGNGRGHSRVAAPRGFLPEAASAQSNDGPSATDLGSRTTTIAFAAPRGYLV